MKKIVILGPESTGKSTLCEQLAAHYKTIWVREYAREYLIKNGMQYSFEQLFEIAQGQLRLEEAAANQIPRSTTYASLFIDTDMYVMKVWSEIVFNKCDNRILTQIAKRKYDLYLLCDTDLPWIKDELREYPELKQRQKIYQFYLDAMVNQQVPWVNINGGYEERLQKAIKAVDELK
ncbi:MAG: ATPase [Sphingobacteriaceae bacterium]|nr:MAG: ATPase [Sphingobacteriaceae bacterium]